MTQKPPTQRAFPDGYPVAPQPCNRTSEFGKPNKRHKK